ncbi:hypothetical protein G9A89_017375 [Geosiphon pyriformis]|nr:hypothetical protein G9A89_017375 [Geosiphon pyriformis]
MQPIYQTPIIQQLYSPPVYQPPAAIYQPQSQPNYQPQFQNSDTKYAQNPNSQNYLSLLVTPEDVPPNNLKTNQKQSLTNNIPPATVTNNKSLAAIFPFELEETTPVPLFSGVTLDTKPIIAMYTNAKVDGHSIKLILDSESAGSIITKQLMNQLGHRVDCTASARIITANGATKTPIEEEEPISSCASELESVSNSNSDSNNNDDKNNGFSSIQNDNNNDNNSNLDSNSNLNYEQYIVFSDLTKEQELKWFSDNDEDIMPECAYTIDSNKKIAQAIFLPLVKIAQLVSMGNRKELKITARGIQGFGLMGRIGIPINMTEEKIVDKREIISTHQAISIPPYDQYMLAIKREVKDQA